MKKNVLLVGAALIFFFLTILISKDAMAVPAFARQTGMSCNSCHYQHFPSLNQMGRMFKSSGYTMVGGQGLVEADILSLPVVLNASLVTKIRYQKTNGDNDNGGTNKGEFQFPDEGALIIGGRAGEHIGFLLEAQLVDPDSSAWASFKVPFVYEIPQVAGTKLAITPFTTDAAGASYGLELLNTGALRIQRVLEHRKDISAQQYINTAREATGVTLSAANASYFANYTIWSPEHGTTDAGPLLHYLRGAVMQTVAGFDAALGFQWWGGTTKYAGGTMKSEAKAFAIDAQAQGPIGNFPVGIYVTYASANKSGTDANLFNSETNDARTAFTVMGEVGVIPDKLTISLAHRAGDTGASSNSSDNATTLGVIYMVTQNVMLQLNHTAYSGDYYDIAANNEGSDGDALTTLMLFAGF